MNATLHRALTALDRRIENRERLRPDAVTWPYKKFYNMQLSDHFIQYGGREPAYLRGAHAKVQVSGGMYARHTLTRTVLTGGLGKHLFEKGIDRRQAMLTVHGPYVAITLYIPKWLIPRATAFANEINARAATTS